MYKHHKTPLHYRTHQSPILYTIPLIISHQFFTLFSYSSITNSLHYSFTHPSPDFLHCSLIHPSPILSFIHYSPNSVTHHQVLFISKVTVVQQVIQKVNYTLETFFTRFIHRHTLTKCFLFFAKSLTND